MANHLQSAENISDNTKSAILQFVSQNALKWIETAKWYQPYHLASTSLQAAAQPKGIRATLHEYQTKALAW